MKLNDIMQYCNVLKKRGNFYSNMIATKIPLQTEEDLEVYQTPNAIMFIQPDHFGKKKLYFAASGEAAMVDILSKAQGQNCVASYIHRQENNDEVREIFYKAGFILYSCYVRITRKYKSNPYLIPEENRRRKLLEKMYDKNCGEYPVESDAEELFEIHRQTFDIISDDFFTIDEWREKIRAREVLIYREDGKIISYYNWKLEGQKLYSNVSVNEGPANILYNLERRVFERYWDEGIRVFYAWYNMKNTKQFRRSNENAITAIETQNYLYEDIYLS